MEGSPTPKDTMMPDFTLGQLIGLLAGAPGLIAEMLFAFGVYHLSPLQTDALNHVASFGGVIAVGFFGADAIIRHGRSRLVQAPPQVTVIPSSAVSSHIQPDDNQSTETMPAEAKDEQVGDLAPGEKPPPATGSQG